MENKAGMKSSEGKSSKLKLSSLYIKRKDSMWVFTDLLNWITLLIEIPT